MGNWRTITVEGSIPEEQIKELNEFLAYGIEDREQEIYYLAIYEGLMGIGPWAQANGNISATGNVFERDSTIEDLEKELSVIAKKFPQLELLLHSGGDNESEQCIATLKAKDGKVEKLTPQIDRIDGVSDELMRLRLQNAMIKPQYRL